MHCLGAVILAVYGVVTAYTWCTKEDAGIMIRQWSQAFGMGGNGNKEAAIQGGSGFFIQYVPSLRVPSARSLNYPSRDLLLSNTVQ